MTDILTSLLGRKKPKPSPSPSNPNPTHSAANFTDATSDGFVVVNGTNGPQSSDFHSESRNQPTQSDNDYESLFSYLRVTQTPNPTMNGIQNGYQPVRPAPPVPNESSLPYPLHRTSTSRTTVASGAATTMEHSNAAHYLTGIPFQVSKSLGGAAFLDQINDGLNIKSPNMAEYEYSFTLEMQVVEESCPKSP